MPIACQCREVAAGPLVGYQVGGAQSGDGPSYIQQQQDPKFRALPCISIYVQSGQDNAATQKSAEGLPLKATGAGSEALQARVAQDNQILSQASLQILGLNSRGDDLGCTVKYDVKKFNSEEVHRKRIAEDPVERLDSLRDAVSSSSSSIGVDNCSSLSVEDDASGEMEVESKYKGPLDRMTELEDSLPVKRGLSNFYSGKSKSFACLSDVTSVKDLAKPENPYNKRRRNMLAYNGWDRSRLSSTRNGISKKGMHSSRSTLALAVAMSQSDDSQETDEQDDVPLPLPVCQVRRQRTFTSPSMVLRVLCYAVCTDANIEVELQSGKI